MEFEPFPKIPRLRRDCTITEKIDGTNAAVVVSLDPVVDEDALWSGWVECQGHDHNANVYAQSRNRFITPEADNFGFAAWVQANAEELARDLGPGRHFGEWWGAGIGRRYGLDHKRFSLFNVDRWGIGEALSLWNVDVVPVLYRGPFTTTAVEVTLARLNINGSVAAPGFPRPEGIIVRHDAGRHLYKVTLEGDEAPKGANRPG